MNQANFSVVILAAGQGTRMRSDTHKVLHPIAGKPMLLHLLDTVQGMGADRVVVVVGKGREQVEAVLAGRDGVVTALQAEQKGTGHAVLMARDALGGANELGGWLEPAFAANNCGAPVTSGPLAGIAMENCAPGEQPALASMSQTATPAPDAVPARRNASTSSNSL